MLNGKSIFSRPKTHITVIISIPRFQAKIFIVKIFHKTRTKVQIVQCLYKHTKITKKCNQMKTFQSSLTSFEMIGGSRKMEDTQFYTHKLITNLIHESLKKT